MPPDAFDFTQKVELIPKIELSLESIHVLENTIGWSEITKVLNAKLNFETERLFNCKDHTEMRNIQGKIEGLRFALNLPTVMRKMREAQMKEFKNENANDD